MSPDEIRVEGFKLAAGSRPLVVTRSSWGLTPFNRRGTVSLVRILYDVVGGARWRGESPQIQAAGTMRRQGDGTFGSDESPNVFLESEWKSLALPDRPRGVRIQEHGG